MNYLYLVALLISALGMLISVRYLIGEKPIKETAMVLITRGTIKVLVGLGCGLLLGVVLAVVEVAVEQPAEKTVLSLMLVGFFFCLSMVISLLFYKATLTKVFNITVSWIRLGKSIALEFLLIVTLSLVAVTLWQLLV